MDVAGNVYLVGYSTSPNLRYTNGFDVSLEGAYDGFIAKLSPSGTDSSCTGPCFFSYLGGSDFDRISAIALDGTTASPDCTQSGKPCVIVVGTTTSSSLGSSGVVQQNYGGGGDAFVARINQTTIALLNKYTYFGGSGRDLGVGVAVDSSGVT